MKDLIEFLHTVGKLKETKRAGWVLKGVPDVESVADHSFRTAIMALVMAEKFGLDREKCVNLALIHDLAEAVVGDITPHDKVSKEEKHKKELSAIRTMFGGGLGQDSLAQLWEEYDEKSSVEAKFVNELDRIEMLLQAFEYEQKHDGKFNLSEFWEYVDKRIEDKKIREIFDFLKKKAKRK